MTSAGAEDLQELAEFDLLSQETVARLPSTTVSMCKIDRECIRKSLQLLVHGESSRAASMLLTQEL